MAAHLQDTVVSMAATFSARVQSDGPLLLIQCAAINWPSLHTYPACRVSAECQHSWCDCEHFFPANISGRGFKMHECFGYVHCFLLIIQGGERTKRRAEVFTFQFQLILFPSWKKRKTDFFFFLKRNNNLYRGLRGSD